jgi:hypothetical protein
MGCAQSSVAIAQPGELTAHCAAHERAMKAAGTSVNKDGSLLTILDADENALRASCEACGAASREAPGIVAALHSAAAQIKPPRAAIVKAYAVYVFSAQSGFDADRLFLELTIARKIVATLTQLIDRELLSLRRNLELPGGSKTAEMAAAAKLSSESMSAAMNKCIGKRGSANEAEKVDILHFKERVKALKKEECGERRFKLAQDSLAALESHTKVTVTLPVQRLAKIAAEMKWCDENEKTITFAFAARPNIPLSSKAAVT